MFIYPFNAEGKRLTPQLQNLQILKPSSQKYDISLIKIYIKYDFQSWLRERAYVVTQAVKTKPAIAEFWRLIWELGSNCIVMLTKVFDFMRVSIKNMYLLIKCMYI